MSAVDILVIGGGPAGAAAAARLAAAGREVLVLERETGPRDKVCGDFLSGPTLAALGDLGVFPSALGAEPISAVALSQGPRRVEAALPFRAASLSRRRLDEALLGAAGRAGAAIRRGARVTGLERTGGGWTARLADGKPVEARHAVLAVGKHDLKGWRRGSGVQSDLVGFKLYWRLSAAEAAEVRGQVELHLFPDGYAGLEPVEGGAANLCLLVRQGLLSELGGRWPALLAHLRRTSPGLARRLAGAEPCADRPTAVTAVPYGFQATSAGGLWRVGDQAAVIPSFAGEGMAIALRSARRAAEALVAGGTPEAYQAALARELVLRVQGASRLSQLLVQTALQPALGGLAGAWPGLLARMAGATRIPEAGRGSAIFAPHSGSTL